MADGAKIKLVNFQKNYDEALVICKKNNFQQTKIKLIKN